MRAYRSAILRFDDDRSARYEEDGLLVIGPDATGRQVVRAVGAYAALAANYPGVAVEHLPGRIIAPGFVDLHVHFPQTDVIGSPAERPAALAGELHLSAGEPLCRCRHAPARWRRFFLQELLRNGVTTALTFATSHPASVDALVQQGRRAACA
jgi:guanine deaminase